MGKSRKLRKKRDSRESGLTWHVIALVRGEQLAVEANRLERMVMLKKYDIPPRIFILIFSLPLFRLGKPNMSWPDCQTKNLKHLAVAKNKILD